MEKFQIVFLCERELNLQKELLTKQVKLFFYELREICVREKIEIEMTFLKLCETPNEIKFVNLDTFSTSNFSLQNLFLDSSINSVNSLLSDDLEKLNIFFVYLSDRVFPSSEYTSFFSRLENSKTIISVISSEKYQNYGTLVKKAFIKRIRKINYGKKKELLEKETKSVYSDKQRNKIKNQKNDKINTKLKEKRKFVVSVRKIAVLASIFFVGICLISFSPIIVQKIKESFVKYKMVYTGDGDRLIFRSSADNEYKEISRLNEGETVILLEDNIIVDDKEFVKVDYHGIQGYLSAQYLIESNKESYAIENPDSMYNYGVALNKWGAEQNLNGNEWIEKAAKLNLLRAQWDMLNNEMQNGKENQSDSDKINYWIEIIKNNIYPYENVVIEKLQENVEINKQSGNEDLVKSFQSNVDYRTKELNNLYKAVYKKLSEVYFDKDIATSLDYYERAVEKGLTAEGEYYYQYAIKFDSNQKNILLEKASKAGYGKASYELANYYFQRSEWRNASSYYVKSLKQEYSKTDSAYYAGYCYWNLADYDNAYQYFSMVESLGIKNDCYYYAMDALGIMYDRGIYVSNSQYYAMYYYGIAKNYVAHSKKRYEELYDYVYGRW